MTYLELINEINFYIKEDGGKPITVSADFIKFSELDALALAYDHEDAEGRCDIGRLHSDAEYGDKQAIKWIEKLKKRCGECVILRRHYEAQAEALEAVFKGPDRKAMDMILADKQQAADDAATNRAELIAEGRY